jgi:hypothetical protein
MGNFCNIYESVDDCLSIDEKLFSNDIGCGYNRYYNGHYGSSNIKNLFDLQKINVDSLKKMNLDLARFNVDYPELNNCNVRSLTLSVISVGIKRCHMAECVITDKIGIGYEPKAFSLLFQSTNTKTILKTSMPEVIIFEKGLDLLKILNSVKRLKAAMLEGNAYIQFVFIN